MIRLVGALLIAGASFSLGLSYIGGEIKNLNALRSVVWMLKELRGELGSRLVPLPELIHSLAGRCTGPGGAFAGVLDRRLPELGETEFDRLWTESADASLDMLDAEERELLYVLGRCLGRYELDRQLTELDSCISGLESRLGQRSSHLPEKKRLGLGIPCSLGALLLIVLI